MRLVKVLTETKLARSGAEAVRLIRQGAVTVGGCSPDCQFIHIGVCTCDGWKKIIDPIAEIESGLAVKVGTGHWRLMTRTGKVGWDQVKGVGRVP